MALMIARRDTERHRAERGRSGQHGGLGLVTEPDVVQSQGVPHRVDEDERQ